MPEYEILRSSTGADLAVWSSRPDGTPKAVVHICHGMAEHVRRYERFGQALNEAGYAVVADDHRGHGETTAPDAPAGYFGTSDGWNQVLADKAFVNETIRSRFPDVPILIFGHSLGGTIAFSYTLRWPQTVKAAAIWNATTNAGALNSVLEFVLGAEKLFRGDKALSVVNAMTFGQWGKSIKGRRTDFDWLSHDPAEVDKYVADPLCGWPASVNFWRDVAGGIRDCADDAKLGNLPKDMPFYLLGGDQDPATEGGKAVLDLDRRLKAAGLTNVTTTIKTSTRHETLNEVDRDQTTKDFIAWADQVVDG